MTKSKYADRETIGSIALKASKVNQQIQAGDMGRELIPQLVDDLNETILSNPYDSRPFYIIIHEKKDLLLKNVILRRMVTQEKRPYPEPNTSVFYTDPKTQETLFCWSLPHTSLFVEYLNNAANYCKEQIKDIIAYNLERLDHFGFYKTLKTKDGIQLYQAIPNFKDRKLRGK